MWKLGQVGRQVLAAGAAVLCATVAAAPAGAATPEERAGALVARMTQAERLAFVGSGAAGVPRLGVPPLAFANGPNGVGDATPGVTVFPNAVALAASWDPALARTYGAAIAREARQKGRTLLGAPTVNIIRTPKWGRAAESFSEDPLLTARLAVAEVRGIQAQKVIAEVKHYAANNQEIGRLGIPLPAPGVDVRVSERALHEIYLPAFKAAVGEGGAASVMCSYNRINGVQACQDPTTLGLLKGFGLRGFVEPDAALGVRDVVAAVNAGVDNFQLGTILSAGGSVGGGGGVIGGDRVSTAETAALGAAVTAGTVPQARIDAAAQAILVAMIRVGVLDTPTPAPKAVVTSRAPHRALATDIAAQGTVLLQNRRVPAAARRAGRAPVLPLGRGVRSVAVIGHDAGAGTAIAEGGSAAVRRTGRLVTPLAGIRDRAPAGTRVRYAAGTRGVVPLPIVPSSVLTPASGSGRGLTATLFPDSTATFTGTPLLTRVDRTVDFRGGRAPLSPLPGNPAARSGRWTGTLTPPKTGEYRFSLTFAGNGRLLIDGKEVLAGNTEFVSGEEIAPGGPRLSFHGNVRLTAGRPVPITIEYATEASIGGSELHLGWQPPEPSLRAAAVAAARKADVAVVFAGDVTAEGMDRTTLSLPGDQDDLIAAVAAVNPRTVVVLHTASAVLMPWRAKVAAIVQAWYPGLQTGTAIARTLFGDVDPSGRLPVTFPASEAQGPTATPARYPGIGNVVPYREGLFVGYRFFDRAGQRPLFPFGHGLSYTSFALGGLRVAKTTGGGAVATVRVRNTGRRTGSQVVQAYVGFPAGSGEPPRQLKAFAKVRLAPGAARTVELALEPSAFQVYDEARDGWKTVPGRFRILVGTSSRDLPLRTTLAVR